MSEINDQWPIEHGVTELLHAAQQGDKRAEGKLFAAIYQDLRRLAQRARFEMRGDGSATSLVHEVYERMAKFNQSPMQGREHFLAIAARAMRQIVIDHARERHAQKRGGGEAAQSLSLVDRVGEFAAAIDEHDQALALEQSLQALGRFDPSLERLVELKFFAGLEIDEIAQLTQRSATSLKRDWRKARAFLHARLKQEDSDVH